MENNSEKYPNDFGALAEDYEKSKNPILSDNFGQTTISHVPSNGAQNECVLCHGNWFRDLNLASLCKWGVSRWRWRGGRGGNRLAEVVGRKGSKHW